MTLEYAVRLLKKDTSADEISKLMDEYDCDKNKIIEIINEAVDLVCDYAERYERLG